MRPEKNRRERCALIQALAADYFEEFVHSCDIWLQRAFRVVGADQDNPGERAKAAALATLYGPHVLSENLLRILNNGFALGARGACRGGS